MTITEPRQFWYYPPLLNICTRGHVAGVLGFKSKPWIVKANNLMEKNPRTATVASVKWGRVRLFVTPWTGAYQAPLSIGFSRQEYWSGLPFPSPGDLPDLGIEPRSSALQADALPSEPPGKFRIYNKAPIAIRLSVYPYPFLLCLLWPLNDLPIMRCYAGRPQWPFMALLTL